MLANRKIGAKPTIHHHLFIAAQRIGRCVGIDEYYQTSFTHTTLFESAIVAVVVVAGEIKGKMCIRNTESTEKKHKKTTEK